MNLTVRAVIMKVKDSVSSANVSSSTVMFTRLPDWDGRIWNCDSDSVKSLSANYKILVFD